MTSVGKLRISSNFCHVRASELGAKHFPLSTLEMVVLSVMSFISVLLIG